MTMTLNQFATCEICSRFFSPAIVGNNTRCFGCANGKSRPAPAAEPAKQVVVKPQAASQVGQVPQWASEASGACNRCNGSGQKFGGACFRCGGSGIAPGHTSKASFDVADVAVEVVLVLDGTPEASGTSRFTRRPDLFILPF